MKEILFNKLETMISKAKKDDFIIYDECEENEKLKLNDDYKSNAFSYKIFKNYIFLKYNIRKKTSDFVELRYVNEDILDAIKQKLGGVKYKEGNLYVKINIENLDQLDALENEIQFIFSEMFLQYMKDESFGCCSKYEECSNKRRCVQTNIRLRYSCMYKKNVDSGRIFYGKNQNIK